MQLTKLARLVCLVVAMMALGCGDAKKSAPPVKPDPIAVDALRLHQALVDGDYDAIRPRLLPLKVLEANRTDEKALRAVFEQYIFPEFARYQGAEATTDEVLDTHVNVWWNWTGPKPSSSLRTCFSYFSIDGKAWIGFQQLMVIAHCMRSYRLEGAMKPNEQLRADARLLESLGLFGSGSKAGKWRSWERICADFDKFLQKQDATREKARKAYSQ